MSKKCEKCNMECAADEKDTVNCEKCKSVLHVLCAGLDASRKNTRNRPFKCEKCRESDSVSSVSDSEESTVLRAINSLHKDFKLTLDNKLSQMEEKINGSVQGKLDIIDERISKWQESLTSSLDGIKSENIALRRDCDGLKVRCDDLSWQVGQLTVQLQDLQQYSRVDNLEIAGVPLTKNEDVYKILQVISNLIKTPWRREDISVAHRLPTGRQKYPNIVVKFTSRTTKINWLQEAKKLRITADMLHNTFPKTLIFINDHLAPHTKATLSRAKQLVKEKHLAFAWVKDGKVLVKLTADGRASRVRSIADAEAVAGRRSSGGDGTASGNGATS